MSYAVLVIQKYLITNCNDLSPFQWDKTYETSLFNEDSDVSQDSGPGKRLPVHCEHLHRKSQRQTLCIEGRGCCFTWSGLSDGAASAVPSFLGDWRQAKALAWYRAEMRTSKGVFKIHLSRWVQWIETNRNEIVLRTFCFCASKLGGFWSTHPSLQPQGCGCDHRGKTGSSLSLASCLWNLYTKKGLSTNLKLLCSVVNPCLQTSGTLFTESQPSWHRSKT